MERFIVWHMENGRKLMKPGIENTVVIYDMAEFGLSNMVSFIHSFSFSFTLSLF